MINTCITSRISLTRGPSPSPFSTYGYSRCSIEAYPFLYPTSGSCCCCCCCFCSDSMYKVQVSPNYCCDLYGFRQSSLIQWAPHRRLIGGGLDRCYYARLPVSDVRAGCRCNGVCAFQGKNAGGRKVGFRRRMVFGESAERCDVEAEAVLSFLSEGIDELGHSRLIKESRKFLKKPVVEEREDDEVSNKISVKKKTVNLGIESGPRCENRKPAGNLRNKGSRREAILYMEEKTETLLREGNEKEGKGVLANGRERKKEEGELLFRKPSRKVDVEQERESILRKENVNVMRSRREESESRKEEDREKVRRIDGSSCSSYYSFSSAGDYASENESEVEEDGFSGVSLSSGAMKGSGFEIIHQKIREEDQRLGACIENHEQILTKKSTEKEFESDFRKKSEKKLTDTSVEVESSKKSLMEESKFSTASERNYTKVSDYFDDRKVKHSSKSTELNEERKQQLVQVGDEDLRQSETRMKHKVFMGLKDTRVDDVRSSYGYQNVYTGKSKMSAKAKNQEKAGEHLAAVGNSRREDRYERDTHKISDVSESQEIDIRKTSISQQRLETSVKVEEHSTNVLTSINVASKQQRDDRVSLQGKSSSGTSQNLTSKNGKSILRRESYELKEQDDNLNIAYGSTSESKQTDSQRRPEIVKRVNSRNRSDECIDMQSGNSGAIFVDSRNENKSEAPPRPLSYLPETSMLSVESEAGSATSDVTGVNLQFNSTAISGDNEERSTLAHNDRFHGQPSEFISLDDAIGSANRLEKSSAPYYGEFVDQLRTETSNSEIQMEQKTSEIKLALEEHDIKQASQLSGSEGPSHEMWKVDEPSSQKIPKPETQSASAKPENGIVKRSGKSLWNVFADIFRLRWSPHSENHSSGRKTGGKSSPNESTSNETWFSGNDAEENQGTSMAQGFFSRHQEEKTLSITEQGSGSSSSQGYLKKVETNEPFSSSAVLEASGMKALEGKGGDTSSSTMVDSSISLPALRLRKFSAMRGGLEIREESPPDNVVKMEQQESSVSEAELKRKRLLRKDQIVKDRFDEWEEACMLEAEQRKIDEMFMKEALLEAKKAADNWEVPVGAVLVHKGKIIARGYNLVEEMRDSTAHAEIICIREASNMLRTWRLSETTLYITLEPCPMCAGAILQARIDTVVWGAPNKLLGADGSWIRLFPIGEGGNNDFDSADKPPAPIHPFHPKIVVRRGVLASECADTMQQFFKLRRKKEKKPETPTPPPLSCLPITHRPSRFMAKMHDTFSLMFCL